jgi:hypothetical protein
MRSDRWAPWAVLGVTLLALVAGWALRASVLGRTRELADRSSGISVAVPQDWQAGAPEDGPVLAAHDPRDPHTALAIAVRDLGERDAQLAQQTYLFNLGQTLDGFRVIDPPEPAEVGIDPAVRFTYVYIDDPAKANPLSRSYPVVIAASGTLIARGGKLYVVTTTTDAARVEEHAAQLDEIVQSIHLP